jgi:N-acetylglucosaminyl-diphospho-decaprenol L-rhamnosyltransferase
MLDLHISIVNHRNRDLLEACLRSLPAACGTLAFAVTVVDNRSEDGSLEMLSRFPAIEVLANSRRQGFSANHNQVLRTLLAGTEGATRYVLVLNDDTEIPPRGLEIMAQQMDANLGLGAMAPRTFDDLGRQAAPRLAYPTLASSLRFDFTGRTERPDTRAGWLQGCCLLLRLEALHAIGLFDERFHLFYEDIDLSRRLVSAGWGLAVCDEVAILHHGSATVLAPAQVGFTVRQGRRSRYLYFEKYAGPRRAELVAIGGRAALGGRAVWLGLRGLLRGNRVLMGQAREAARLAGFNPRRPLEVPT